MLANTDKSGEVKAVTIEAGQAVAQLSKTEGARVVKVKDFFAAVKDRSDSFFDCLTVAIGKAEKLIGKDALDKISKKKTTNTVTFRFKK
ncbi:MAG TPA: hypothetical protein PKY59_12385 [Pyrinomonadaceae bacterium]|nr:hypothetical protein [Pyrinomonadaceae bacterium]